MDRIRVEALWEGRAVATIPASDDYAVDVARRLAARVRRAEDAPVYYADFGCARLARQFVVEVE